MNEFFGETYCQNYLQKRPIAQSMARMIECSVLCQLKLSPPVLDLGCGDGFFSQICFGKDKIEVGLDSNQEEVEKARKSHVYRKVVLAEAVKIPFGNGYFKTVVSNSALEHFQDLEPVFDEVYRVLDKGGKFIFTVPDKKAIEYFFYPFIDKYYAELKRKIHHYYHLEDESFWVEMALRSGFKINQKIGLASPESVKCIDFFTPFALLNFFSRRFLNKNFLFRPKFINKMVTPLILSFCGPVKDDQATGWCFELEK